MAKRVSKSRPHAFYRGANEIEPLPLHFTETRGDWSQGAVHVSPLSTSSTQSQRSNSNPHALSDDLTNYAETGWANTVSIHAHAHATTPMT